MNKRINPISLQRSSQNKKSQAIKEKQRFAQKLNPFNAVISFIKYHNLFTIILGLVLLLTGSIFASEDVKNAVIGEKIATEQGIDNSQILTADLTNFNLNLQIIDVNEDEKNYYIDYTYQTFEITSNNWQLVSKEKTLTVSKADLEDEDLGIYVQEELSEMAVRELSYLKEVQDNEKNKGVQALVASVEYTGLIGLVLDIKNNLFPEYKPVVQLQEMPAEIQTSQQPTASQPQQSGQPTTSPSVCQNGANRSCNTEVGACQIGIEICQQGVWGECIGAVMPSEEMCDGVDNDCDGYTDEDNICGGGSYGVPSSPEETTEPEPTPEPEPEVISPEPIIEPESGATSTDQTVTSTEPIIEPDISTSTDETATSTE